MYNKQIKNLIRNLTKPTKPITFDLVLEGGGFNGMYEVGVLLFIKELEKQGFIKVDKISGVSIGSIMGLSYFTDQLGIFTGYYKELREYWKNNLKLDKYEEKIKKYIIDSMDDECFNKIKNDKLYINYNSVETLENIVQSKYNDKYDLLNAILKSSHLPYITKNELCQEQYFIDGGYPFIFYNRYKQHNRKMLYVSINNISEMTTIMNVKDINCDGKILAGILECYNLFNTGNKNNLCSFIHQWSYNDYIILRIKQIIIKILVISIFLIYRLRQLWGFVLNKCIVKKYLQKIKEYDNFKVFELIIIIIKYFTNNISELYRDFILYYCF